ncbi:hypothetical protein A7Q02_04875 [Eikenella sp. NML97-A-109]|nr:hypothetical protein A7Q02_04875 [Eikenella sp. NML97-A-109]
MRWLSDELLGGFFGRAAAGTGGNKQGECEGGKGFKQSAYGHLREGGKMGLYKARRGLSNGGSGSLSHWL